MKREIVFKLYSNELKKNKTIRVYLPKNYYSSSTFYKVLYLHDGQNIYHESPFSHSSWGVIETLTKNNLDLLVVAIDNDKDRVKEYVPFSPTHDKRFKSKAKEYSTFIVNTLIPHINNTFRTLKGKENTFIAGSSYGAVTSLYTSMLFKDTFSLIGLFSFCSFEFQDEFEKEFYKLGIDTNANYFIAVGDNEGNEDPSFKCAYLGNFKWLNEEFTNKNIKFNGKIYKEGYHSEVCWKEQFKDFIRENKKILQ